MLIHPRVALASGLAAAAGLALLITGRIEGSVLTAAALAVAARAAPLAASDSLVAPRALARQAAAAPVWVGLAVVASMRAGSVQVGDIAGAHAVAGLALFHGSPALVAAAWLMAAAAAIAIAVPAPEDPSALQRTATQGPVRRLEILAVGLQAGLAVALLAGPQVTRATDLVPWMVGALVAAGLILALPRLARRPGAARLAPALAVAAVVLAALGEPP